LPKKASDYFPLSLLFFHKYFCFFPFCFFFPFSFASFPSLSLFPPSCTSVPLPPHHHPAEMAKADAPKKEKKEKKEKAPRAPSPYNEFMKTEIAKVKAGNPGLDHKEAFKVAASHVSHFCPRLRHPVAPLLFLLVFFFFFFCFCAGFPVTFFLSSLFLLSLPGDGIVLFWASSPHTPFYEGGHVIL